MAQGAGTAPCSGVVPGAVGLSSAERIGQLRARPLLGFRQLRDALLFLDRVLAELLELLLDELGGLAVRGGDRLVAGLVRLLDLKIQVEVGGERPEVGPAGL